ncbi:hypothetical protein [Caballeronia sp. AZ1_KS37]|uniref:phage adaptor protein n=1 Tax=Caballeronia sp. AZ1_KS37 TaxID=2921756 RepID=UPI0020296274|nr:hypothetical protein [Caballeronia sp. AZ1_KS37]
MALSSYQDLQATVTRFGKRPDIADLIPDFIALAEVSLNRVLRTTQQRTHYSITPTTACVSLPTDLCKIVKVSYGGHPLDAIPESRTATDPAYQQDIGYSIHGGKLFLQVPSLGSVLRIEYFQELEPLSDANVSNWLLEDAPDVYLYASLIQLALYIRDDARLQIWTQAYTQVLNDLIDSDKDSQLAQNTPLTMKAG